MDEREKKEQETVAEDSYWGKKYRDMVERFGKEFMEEAEKEYPLPPLRICPDKGVTIETLQWCFERDKAERELAKEQKALEEKQGS